MEGQSLEHSLYIIVDREKRNGKALQFQKSLRRLFFFFHHLELLCFVNEVSFCLFLASFFCLGFIFIFIIIISGSFRVAIKILVTESLICGGLFSPLKGCLSLQACK